MCGIAASRVLLTRDGPPRSGRRPAPPNNTASAWGVVGQVIKSKGCDPATPCRDEVHRVAGFSSEGVTRVEYVSAFPDQDAFAVWLGTETDDQADLLRGVPDIVDRVREVLRETALTDCDLEGLSVVRSHKRLLIETSRAAGSMPCADVAIDRRCRGAYERFVLSLPGW